MKSIVFLSAFLSPYRSGAEAMVEEVSVRLVDQYDITIITGRYSRSLPRKGMLGGGVRVVRVGFGLPIDKYVFPFFAALEVRRLRPFIVHAVLESYAGLAMVLCRYISRRSLRILTLQSTNTFLCLGVIHRSAQRITAISRTLITRAAGFGRRDVTLIPNGIPLAQIAHAVQTHAKVPGRVLFVGRLEPMKGIDILLQAFQRVCADVSVPQHVRLRIVGRGSQNDALQALSRELGIEHRVTFVGHLSADKVYEEYAQAEIFCGLSRSEALGNVFLEAQAAGCAVVATRVGGIPEIVDHQKAGFLVERADVEGAALALVRLLTDESTRKAFASYAREGKEQFDWSAISERYHEVYEERA